MMQETGAARELYTATEIATFIAALGVLVTGVGAVIVNIIVALKQGQRVEAAAIASGKAHNETQRQVEEVKQEAKVIAGHVNSAATASTSKIDGLQRELDAMKQTAAEMKTTAALLAQAVAGARAIRSTDAATDHARDKPDALLAKIETNTKDTAAGVQDLKDR